MSALALFILSLLGSALIGGGLAYGSHRSGMAQLAGQKELGEKRLASQKEIAGIMSSDALRREKDTAALYKDITTRQRQAQVEDALMSAALQEKLMGMQQQGAMTQQAMMGMQQAGSQPTTNYMQGAPPPIDPNSLLSLLR